MTQKKNALFFLFDSLRYDVFSDMRRAQVLAPNLVKLIERGFLCPVISNGNATQFVMPSLFSLTYPLDYGGYSNGVVDRPKTFPELLREAGYDTHLTTTTYHLFPGHGYERGFNTTHAPLYYGGMVHTRIRNQVLHYLELEEAGEISRAELEDQVRVEITAIMDAVELAVRSADNGTWSRGLRRRNQQILAAAREERALVQKYPAAVIDKIANVPLKYLAKHLGRKRPTLLLPLMRVRDKIFKVARLFAVSRHFPFLVGSFQIVADDAVPGVLLRMAESKKPWYWHLHLMDLHDCQNVGRLTNVTNQLRFLPKRLRAWMKGVRFKHRFNYELAIMYLDDRLGRLIAKIDEMGELDNTVIVVLADHGLAYGGSPRKNLHISHRMHAEDIEVPLIVAGAGRNPAADGLLDTRDVAATMLEALGIDGHDSFRGRSAFGPGRRVVVTENAGAGAADLQRKTLFFTVTTEQHRLMLELHGNELSTRELYDRIADPTEVDNLVKRPESQATIEAMLAHLWAERGEILRARRVAERPG